MNELERKCAMQAHLKSLGSNIRQKSGGTRRGSQAHASSGPGRIAIARGSRVSPAMTSLHLPGSITAHRTSTPQTGGVPGLGLATGKSTRTSTRIRGGTPGQTMRRTYRAIPRSGEDPTADISACLQLRVTFDGGVPLRTIPIDEAVSRAIGRVRLGALSRSAGLTHLMLTEVAGSDAFYRLAAAMFWLVHDVSFPHPTGSTPAPPPTPSTDPSVDPYLLHDLIPAVEHPTYPPGTAITPIDWLRDLVALQHVALGRAMVPGDGRDAFVRYLPLLLSETVLETSFALFPRTAGMDCGVEYAAYLRQEMCLAFTGISQSSRLIESQFRAFMDPRDAPPDPLDTEGRDRSFERFQLFPHSASTTPKMEGGHGRRATYRIPDFRPRGSPDDAHTQLPAHTGVGVGHSAPLPAAPDDVQLPGTVQKKLLQRVMGVMAATSRPDPASRPSFEDAKAQADLSSRVAKKGRRPLSVDLYVSPLTLPDGAPRPTAVAKLDVNGVSPLMARYHALVHETGKQTFQVRRTLAEREKEDALAAAIKQCGAHPETSRKAFRAAMAAGTLQPIELPNVYGTIAESTKVKARRSRSECAGQIKMIERDQEKALKVPGRQRVISRALVDGMTRDQEEREARLDGDGLDSKTVVELQRARHSLDKRMDRIDRLAHEAAIAQKPGVNPVAEAARIAAEEPLPQPIHPCPAPAGPGMPLGPRRAVTEMRGRSRHTGRLTPIVPRGGDVTAAQWRTIAHVLSPPIVNG